MTTLIAGSTALAVQLGAALAHGDPDDYIRLSERAETERVLLDGAAVDPTPDGLRVALQEHAVRAVIDATDPFAEGVSPDLEKTCNDLGIPHLRAAPTSFERLADASRWHWVDTFDQVAGETWRAASSAVIALEPMGLCYRLGDTSGRAVTAYRKNTFGHAPFPPWLREPEHPVRVTSEAVSLIEDVDATVLVANDTGDSRVRPLLAASTTTGIEVVMVRRSPRWQGGDASRVVHDVVDALRWRNTVL